MSFHGEYLLWRRLRVFVWHIKPFFISVLQSRIISATRRTLTEAITRVNNYFSPRINMPHKPRPMVDHILLCRAV